jgi:hypothetical protein
MELGRAILLAAVTLVAGLVGGVALGYHVARLERLEVERELVKVRGWLEEEIRQADAARQARDDEGADQRALARARADLRQVQGDLARSRATAARLQALLREAQADWRSELQRRRLLQERVETLERQRTERATPRP